MSDEEWVPSHRHARGAKKRNAAVDLREPAVKRKRTTKSSDFEKVAREKVALGQEGPKSSKSLKRPEVTEMFQEKPNTFKSSHGHLNIANTSQEDPCLTDTEDLLQGSQDVAKSDQKGPSNTNTSMSTEPVRQRLLRAAQETLHKMLDQDVSDKVLESQINIVEKLIARLDSQDQSSDANYLHRRLKRKVSQESPSERTQRWRLGRGARPASGILSIPGIPTDAISIPDDSDGDSDIPVPKTPALRPKEKAEKILPKKPREKPAEKEEETMADKSLRVLRESHGALDQKRTRRINTTNKPRQSPVRPTRSLETTIREPTPSPPPKTTALGQRELYKDNLGMLIDEEFDSDGGDA